ncbi:MAG: hypothetical protein ACFE8M_11230 [Candidatus Hermodarchaeota archaeon]
MVKSNIEDFEELNTIGEFNLILEDNCTNFAKELEQEISKARAHHKRIEYYSDNLTVYSYKKDLNMGQDILIFETVYKNENKVELSFIANRSMYGSHLLYLINRAELRSK